MGLKTIKKYGFTLMEMIITIMIIGVLASLAIPRFSFSMERTRSAEGVQALSALLTAQKLYFQENGAYTGTYADLDITVDTLDNFDNPLTDVNVTTSTNKVALVRRKEGASTLYTLCIDENAKIMCNNGTITVCANFNYPAGCT